MIEILKNGLSEMKKNITNKNTKLELANLLTLSRFFSPFILLPLYYLNQYKLFIVFIIIFCLTDTFDGYFARKYKVNNTFGKYLDATVDKIFAFTLFIPVISKTNYFILIIELCIMIVNIYEFYKHLKPKTKFIGKVKTVFLFILISILYLNKVYTVNNIYILILIYITIILQIITLITYIMLILKKTNSNL